MAQQSSRPDGTDRPSQITSTAELARYLNVSQWTVSRAINGHKDVGEKTRERVLKAMAEFSYQPSALARGLRGGSTGMIGVSFSRHNVPIVDQKMFELQQYLQTSDYRCIFESTMNRIETELSAIQDFLRLKVEGVVLIQPRLTPQDSAQLLEKTPCVIVDSMYEGHDCCCISLDRDKAMSLLLEHLLELGHRRFALLGIGADDGWRWPPLVNVAIQHGLDPAEAFSCFPDCKHPESFVVAGTRLAKQVLEVEPSMRPTALICLDDLVAFGAIQTIRRAGLSVPDDFSVTGFNNQDIGRNLFPSLTTIEQHPDQLMEHAGSMLLNQIKSKSDSVDGEKVVPSLVIGESTGPVMLR